MRYHWKCVMVLPTFAQQEDVLSAHAAVPDANDSPDAVTTAGEHLDREIARHTRADVVAWAVHCADVPHETRDALARSGRGERTRSY